MLTYNIVQLMKDNDVRRMKKEVKEIDVISHKAQGLKYNNQE